MFDYDISIGLSEVSLVATLLGKICSPGSLYMLYLEPYHGASIVPILNHGERGIGIGSHHFMVIILSRLPHASYDVGRFIIEFSEIVKTLENNALCVNYMTARLYSGYGAWRNGKK